MSSLDFDPAKLNFLRKKLNLTQAKFASQAGVSQSFIAKLEAGRLDPTYSKVKKITEALDRLSHQEEKKACDIMTKDVMEARPSDLVSDLVSLMAKKGISQLPVMDGNKALGILTEMGILEAQSKKPLPELKAKDAMAEVPPMVSPTTPASAIIGLLRYFPAVLVSKDGAILGIITKSDVLKSALRE